MSFLKAIGFWCALPLRTLMWGCAFIFGHPASFTLLFVGVATAAAFGHRLQLAGACIGVVGLLLMWVAENPGSSNKAWPARSPFAAPLPVEA